MDQTDKSAVEMQILQRMVTALEETVLKLTREVALLKQKQADVDGRVFDRDTRHALMSHAPSAVFLVHDEVRGMNGVEMTHGMARGLDGLNERGHGLDRLNGVLPSHASDARDAAQDDQGDSSGDFMGWDPLEVCVKYQTGCDKPGCTKRHLCMLCGDTAPENEHDLTDCKRESLIDFKSKCLDWNNGYCRNATKRCPLEHACVRCGADDHAAFSGVC